MFPRRHRAAQGNAETLPPRWSGKSLQRETRAANAEGSRELEEDQRPGLKGLPQVAGAGRASASPRHRHAEPCCFYTAPGRRLAKLLPSFLDWC